MILLIIFCMLFSFPKAQNVINTKGKNQLCKNNFNYKWKLINKNINWFIVSARASVFNIQFYFYSVLFFRQSTGNRLAKK